MKALLACLLLSLVPASDARFRQAAPGTSDTPRRLMMPLPGTAIENATTLNRFFSDPAKATLEIGPGTYLLPCGSHFAASGSLSIAGAGRGRTVLRLERACRIRSALMSWTSKSNVRLSGFTLDLNDSRSATRQNIVQFEAYNGDADGLQVDHVAILHGNSLSLQVAVAAAGGFTYSGVVIHGNYLEMRPGHTQNQCIALTTVNGAGRIPYARVTDNICRGSGIQVDGVGTLVARNDVSAYQFGTGIFAAFTERTAIVAAHWSDGRETLRLPLAHHAFSRGEKIYIWGSTPGPLDGSFVIDQLTADGVSFPLLRPADAYRGGSFLAPDASSRDCVFSGNVIHDTRQTPDVNTTAPGGIENNCVGSRVENNQALNLGGAGFVNYASGATYTGNHASGVGFTGHGSAGGEGDNAAFAVFDNGSGMPWYRSSALAFKNNSSEPRSGRPKYGYFEEPWHRFYVRFGANQFYGAAKSMIVRSVAPRAAPVPR